MQAMNTQERVPALTHRMLEVFRAVVMHSGISAAARALDISQPSVSRLVADLERSTRLKLFAKRGRAIIPTAQGIALYEQIDRSFIGLADIARHARQLREQDMGRLSVACLPALGHVIVPQAMAALREAQPTTRVKLQIDTSLAVTQMVASMQVDIGFVAAAARYPAGVERIGRITGACRCILPAGHALAREKALTFAKLRDQPFVALSGNSRIRQRLEATLPDPDAAFRVVAETKQTASASELVLRGVGVSVVDPFIAAEHVRRGGVAVRFRPAVEYDLDTIAHADRRLGEAARMLCDQVLRLARD